MREMDILGDQLMATLAFARSGFNPETELQDAVHDEAILAGKMFYKSGKRWFMVQDSLPGDINLKAIAADADGILLETAPLNGKKVAEALWEEKVAANFRDDRFLSLNDAELARLVPARRKLPKKIAPRQLWTIPWSKLSEHDQQLAVEVMDTISSADAYEQAAPLSGVNLSAAGMLAKPSLDLRMDLRQMLELEQRPILTGRLDTSLELQGIMAIQHKLLTMTQDEIEAWAAAEVQKPDGERRVRNILVFVMARRIRDAMPERKMSWKQLRAAARKILGC